MNIVTKLAIGAGAGVVVLGVLWYAKNKAGDVLAGFGESVHVAVQENPIYTGVNAAGAAVTGDESFNVGAWWWEFTHPAEVAAEKRVTGGASGTW